MLQKQFHSRRCRLCGHRWPHYAEQYRELFPGEVLFDQEATELRYPKEWLEARVDSADETVEQVCEAQCNRMLASLGSGEAVIDDVRRALLSKPANQRLDIAEVARGLNLSVRTLERRLHSSGTSFRALDNETRMGLAAQYLQLGYLSGTEISYMLGYSQPAIFYRAFRNYYGKTLKEFLNTRG